MTYTEDRTELEKRPTLSVGQCCDLKHDDGERRVWVCRGDGTVSVERIWHGRWQAVKGH